MTASGGERTTEAAAGKSGRLEMVAAFTLAGMALFGFVLGEYDVPHDNPQGIIVIGAGALAGLVAGIAVGGRTGLRDRATGVAWDVVRLVLAYEMIRYGIPKLIGMQFYPQYWRIDQRSVDLTPGQLAWTFLGRNYWYQAFGGLIEVGSGVLVCFRRTTLLGACLMTTALLNVVLINYFYDVPVKLFASVYLLFDVALIAREWPRLRALFLAPVERIERGTWARWLYGLAITGAIAGATVKMVREGLEHRVFQREPLEGAWSIDERSGAVDPAWDRVYFEKDDVGFIRMGANRSRFEKRVTGSDLQLTIAGADHPHVVRGSFALDGQTLRFAGTCDDHPCTLRLRKEFPR